MFRGLRRFAFFAVFLAVAIVEAKSSVEWEYVPGPRGGYRRKIEKKKDNCRTVGHVGGPRWGPPTTHRVCGQTPVNCAPEVVEGNTKATDRVLSNLVASPEFAEAKSFKVEVTRIAALKDSGLKAQNYLAILGIDPEDSAAVVEFIGARDARGAWLYELQRNSGLNAEQAQQVAQAVQNALRGGLQ